MPRSGRTQDFDVPIHQVSSLEYAKASSEKEERNTRDLEGMAADFFLPG
jgi:hypothetical protein